MWSTLTVIAYYAMYILEHKHMDAVSQNIVHHHHHHHLFVQKQKQVKHKMQYNVSGTTTSTRHCMR